MNSADYTSDFSGVQQTVQHNCAISDARYSREYSLCIYLLRLREFYRWKKKIPLGESIDQELLGDWVNSTEEHWDSIEHTDFQPLSINGLDYDPFDIEAINNQLENSGLLYSAGFGRLGQPHFVLAKQLSKGNIEQCTHIECGEELARDIMTLPAMTQGKTLYIRHESFAHLLWQMFDEWNIHNNPGPMARLVNHYNISNNDQLEQQIRAVRDLLADSLNSWVWIANNRSLPHLDFWLSGLIGYREIIFNMTNPGDALFSDDPDARLSTLSSMIDSQQHRWQQVALELISEYKTHGIEFDVEKTIKQNIEPNS